MTPKFIKFKRHSGFSKEKSVASNVNTMLRNAPKNYSPESKKRLAIRQATALANITKDKPTEKKARAVASELSRRLAKSR